MLLLQKVYKKYKHFLLLTLYGVLYLWFFYLEKTIIPKYYMFSPFDKKIPFIKEFIIPYLFWYIYMGFAFIYLGIVSKRDYYRLFLFIFLGVAVCYSIYSIYPNAQGLRPVIKETDILSRIIKHTYKSDTNTNVAPSIHVLNSIAVHIGLIGYEPFKKKWQLRLTSLILMIIISASTVFVKQHSILDGMWAILLSIVLYVAIYLVPNFIAGRQDTEEVSKKAVMPIKNVTD